MAEKEQSRFLKTQARKTQKICQYNMVDIKHSLEQAIRELLIFDYNYREDHKFINFHLFCGYLAAISAISSAAYGYTHDFDEQWTKPILTIGCSIYFIFTSVLYFVNQFIKKDTIFVGVGKDDRVVVHMKTSKYSDIVDFEFEFIQRDKSKLAVPLKKSCTRWFTDKGEFAAKPFLEDVEVVMKTLSKKTK